MPGEGPVDKAHKSADASPRVGNQMRDRATSARWRAVALPPDSDKKSKMMDKVTNKGRISPMFSAPSSYVHASGPGVSKR